MFYGSTRLPHVGFSVKDNLILIFVSAVRNPYVLKHNVLRTPICYCVAVVYRLH